MPSSSHTIKELLQATKSATKEVEEASTDELKTEVEDEDDDLPKVNRNLFDQMYDKINDLQVQSSMEKEDILKLFDMMTMRQTKIIVDNQAINLKL